MRSLLERHFVIVGGKGGVGRTVVSLVLGRLAAAAGKKVLVCLCNAPPRYTRLVGGVALGPNIASVGPNLEVVNLEPRASQEEYGHKIIHNRLLHKVVFGSSVVRAFLDAVPGLSEWAILGKATYHALPGEGGQRSHDLVIFDSPATGHGLDILSLPATIAASIPPGRMRDEALARVELLSDPQRCEVVPVTLAEDIPVRETFEYVARLRDKRLSVCHLIVNKVQATGLSPQLEALLDQSEPATDYLIPAAAARGGLALQAACLEDLSGLRLPIVTLPKLHRAELDEQSLDRLARVLSNAAFEAPGAA
ncbi:MAG: anion-transporting ATPase [Myxococcota bacterium]|jgi:anion-transporting  ArsA/GET3 family ATPase|nr:anion-transporting ATPase [Myxococcota bacterium]